MTRLVDALEALGIHGDIALGGRWVTLQVERTHVYVVENSRGGDYFTWCEDARARTVEWFTDPTAAIQAGLRRAAVLSAEPGTSGGFPTQERSDSDIR